MSSLEKNIWILDQWYAQDVAGNVSYSASGDPGTLWSMGYNNGGGLGHNNRTKYSSPTQVPGTWIGVGGVKSDGTLWSWGYNGIGQLGLNTVNDDRSSPTQVGTDTDWKAYYGKIGEEDSEDTCFAVKTDGTLWGWGWNRWGQLGQNEAGSPGGSTNERATSRSSPVQIPGTTWPSSNSNGTFGYVDRLSNIITIKTDGTMWGLGSADYGTLALNNKTYYSSPVQIPGTTWKTISGGMSAHYLATKTDGTLWGWGRNEYGNLGLNDRVYYSSPTQVGSATDWDVAQGNGYTFGAVKTDGTLWVCGWNGQGNLGQGGVISNPTKISSPVQIPGTTWKRGVKMGQNAMGAIKTDGTAWVWGEGQGGQLGQNSLADSDSPVQIPGSWVDMRGSESTTRLLRAL